MTMVSWLMPGYQYLYAQTIINDVANAIQYSAKGGNHDLQPVSVALKPRIKAHILYSTLVRSEFGVEYEIVISRSRLLRSFGEQESLPTIFSPSVILRVSGV
jgi:hypothetical protein